MQHVKTFGIEVCRTQLRSVSERMRAARAALTFDPGPLAEQQFLRYVHYRQLAECIPRWIGDRRRLRVIEFGGSNGVIAQIFTGAGYEVAPDFPAIDIQDLGAYSDQSYDAVVVDQVLEHVPDPTRAVAELRRILKHGGLCVATTPFLVRVHGYPHDYQRFTSQGLARLFSRFSRCNVDGWGNRYTLEVIHRYGWLSAKNTKRLLHVALWNEADWPIDFLTLAFR